MEEQDFFNQVKEMLDKHTASGSVSCFIDDMTDLMIEWEGYLEEDEDDEKEPENYMEDEDDEDEEDDLYDHLEK